MIPKTQPEIRQFFEDWRPHRDRTIVVVDYSNVRRWRDTLGWDVSIPDLGRMATLFSKHQSLRRFHCAADFGPKAGSMCLSQHSADLIASAEVCGFGVVAKRVKYIRDPGRPSGYVSKCDLDVDIATDLFAQRDAYDRIVLFSGDGDFVRALTYLHQEYGKESVVVSAVGARAQEIIDAHAASVVSAIIYADDLKLRLDGRCP